MENENYQQSKSPKLRRSWQEVLISDAVLGSLVVLFTVTTAFAAYRASSAEINGSDLDFNAQLSLTLATTAFLQGSIEMQEDASTFQAFTLLKDRDSEAAATMLATASDPLLEGMQRESGPFDEIYEETRYAEANAHMEASRQYHEEGNMADDEANAYHTASLFLAVGLAITAWASLFNTRPRLRFIFTIIAMPMLAIGLVLVSLEIFG